MRPFDDETDDDQDDRENPSPEDLADGDEPATQTCPHCRRQIHEDTEICHYCGHYLSREDAPPLQRPGWFIAGMVAMILILIVFLMRSWW